MRRNRILPVLTLVAVTTALAAAYAIARATPPSFYGTDLGPGIAAPDFTLEAAELGRVSLSDFRGRAVLMFFGYTHCPDVCPITMGKLRRALELAGERAARDVQVLLVTVDPALDSPERMREFLLNFDPGFVGLTGSRDELEVVAAHYGAYMGPAPAAVADDRHAGHDAAAAAADDPPRDDPHVAHGGHGGHRLPPRLIDHTSQVFGIDRRGNFRLLWGSDVTAERIAEDVRQLLRL